MGPSYIEKIIGRSIMEARQHIGEQNWTNRGKRYICR